LTDTTLAKTGPNRTRIVCTLGPASSDADTLRDMIDVGMNVARINLSHGTHADHASVIALVRNLADEKGQVVAILADLQGPKIRIGKIAGEPMMLHEGREVILTAQPETDGDNVIPVPHPEIIRGVEVDGSVWLDDGLLELAVEGKDSHEVRCRVVTGGPLVSRKGISAPGVYMDVPSITPKDKEDLQFAIAQEADYIAQSFVRTVDDILQLRRLINNFGADIPIVAKIERPEALENFERIASACNVAMVARGDLGVEIPVEDVPLHQKRIIRICNALGRPVITATQMLNSMMLNPRPTRAEAADVFNAILDGTDAVMLSGETAVGEYPVRTVRTMARIAQRAEVQFPYDSWGIEPEGEHSHSIPEAIGRATCSIAAELGAKAIITSTRSGYTALQVAKQRPRIPIICTTPSPETYRRMALVWGVIPVMAEEFRHTDEMVRKTMRAAVDAGVVEQGDLVVITAGTPVKKGGQTNLLKVHWVGEDEQM
jgi:pyruvate kinase